MAVAIACFCTAGYASAEILSRYPSYREWGKAQQDYDSGYFEKAIGDYRRLYRKLDREKAFLFESARCLTFTGQYPESNEILDRYLFFDNDPAIRYLKAKNYGSMNDYNAAEKMYLHSLEMLPGRYDTLLLLVNFYDETGQTEKAKEIKEMIEPRREKATEGRRHGK